MTAERPYDGVRVVDLTGDLSAYATRLFANLGADVVMVERPEGRADRRREPFAAAPALGGAPFAFFNAGKKSVVIDYRGEDGARALNKLIAEAQIVMLETDAALLLPLVLQVPGPRIVVAVSHFGLDGPYADFIGCDLVTQSLGGIAWLSGIPGEPPLRLPAEQSAMVTSVYAAVATALALWDLEVHGHGHFIDVSAQEAIGHSLQNAPQVWDLERRVLSRGGEGIRDSTEDIFACQDGSVFLAAPLSLAASWKSLLAWMAEEGDAGQKRLMEADWQSRPKRATAAMRAEFRGIFERFIAAKTRAEIRDQALARKIVMAPVSRVGELVDDPQLAFRQFFGSIAHPALEQPLRFPGAPYRFSEPVWAVGASARLGEHAAGFTSDLATGAE